MFRNIIAILMITVAANVAARSIEVIEYGDVTSVRPMIREQCYSEPSYGRYDDRYEQPRSRTAPVLGAIVGAAVGNQIGDGRGRDAATVAGAALGYSITRDNQERNRYNNQRQYSRYESRGCDQRVDGYEVTFWFNGREYRTVMRNHPGDRIRLRGFLTAE